MSRDTQKNWVYSIVGRNVELWEVSGQGNVASTGTDRVKPISSEASKKLVYPTETIVNGLMFEGTAFIEPFIDVDPNELDENSSNPTVSPVATPDESSHMNLNRMFSLAVVDYIKAMWSDKQGDIQKKEYYMREFWRKAADAQSNKFGVFMCAPSSVYSIR